jgi:hypothetical protein
MIIKILIGIAAFVYIYDWMTLGELHRAVWQDLKEVSAKYLSHK